MSDLAAVLDAIDTLITGCTLCGQPLGDSPSQDFCSEDCQWRWKNIDILDPGGVNRAMLADEIERRNPSFEFLGNWVSWPMTVLSRPRDCPHCGMLLALGEAHHGGWGWMGFGEPYERQPGEWLLQTKWHTPDRCREAVAERDQGVLIFGGVS